MKTRFIFTVFTLLATAMFGFSCSEEMTGTDELLNEMKIGELAAGCPVCGTITGEEAAAILFMYDEEKMARDLYAEFYKMYKIPVFKNISKSENVHMQAVGSLVKAFGLKYNGTDKPGEFVNPEIARLYSQLVEMGKESLTGALKAGALVEETDILDLQDELQSAGNASVKRVFTNILAGSENHLRAFVNQLKFRKTIYEPVLIKDLDYYKAILSNTTGTRK
ncbi:MAG TPA: DUF2202 domain-containing protein [Prolixibacteraceae bacterium]|nr:DUF2202 domain-containing protein [Prolixibacteraceae bacterium]HOR99708.1 DUF2202 domain-containing protein [Prolixibacteraceae bacterium]HOS89124.1 DUF2202 domain-containing protein [Prolixibacteraceae bacterium]HPL44248.1 DUF2202 domain-containing protein [Prolixibacteraceae bacterium]HQJ84616.1 DUF2202 domain-containing protein [Prolixibacteraceae bacterium]